MAVIPLESLPLGFRFRPTDEELINYYLKRKITGDIRSEREVIPEIDVCKCEPWDLPDKALIRSEDPEWFFFAPKDRKYPNGSRSNRATEKGYWKATGKDRIIRSKGPVRQATVVGMKKTLVFHKGRAPRGERTHWIMHEYRTTEPDYESGEQGGYVLYKLFRKTDERAPGTAEEAELSTVDEVDTSGFSPAPSRSSPGGAQQDGETLDEITAPVDHKSVLQDDHLNIPNSAAGKTVGTQRWLDDRADCKPAKHNVNDSNFAIGQPQNMEPPPDALLDQFSDPQYKKNEYLFGPAKQESHHLAGQSGNDNNLSDDANDIIDSFFAEPDAYYSPGESTWQDNSADVAVSDNVESTNQRVVNQDEAVWSDGMINIDELLMDVPDECLDLYCADAFNGSSLYENAVPLPYVGTDQDVHSVDSGADSLQDLFSTLEESSTQRNNLMPCNDTNGLDDPGLVIRPHQLDHLITHNVAPRSLHIGNQQNANFISSTQFNYMSANNDTFEGTGITRRPRIEYQLQSGRASGLSVNHGIAARRLCLQTRLDIGTMSCSPSGSVKRDGTELDEQVDEKSDEFSAEVAAAPSDASSVDKFDELSVKDDNDAPKTEDAIRLRKKITGPMGTESVEIKSFVSPKRAPKKLSVPHRFWFVMSAAVILCIGILSLCYSIGKAESVGVQSLLSNLTLL